MRNWVWVWGIKFNPPHTHLGYGWGTGARGTRARLESFSNQYSQETFIDLVSQTSSSYLEDTFEVQK